jgi:hypothetical protein
VAVVVAIAMVSASPAPADCRYPPGAPHTKDYCTNLCDVPDVLHKRRLVAIELLHEHGCRVKGFKPKRARNIPGFQPYLVVRAELPRSGTYGYRFRVRLYYKYKYRNLVTIR